MPEPVVLVVDDEAGVRRLVARVLENADIEVVQAASPQSALEVLRSRGDDLDLVITDVAMPQMTGFELWDRIRADRPGLPFLFLSGYVAPDFLDSAADAEPSFLAKPFEPAELMEKVHEVLRDRDRPD